MGEEVTYYVPNMVFRLHIGSLTLLALAKDHYGRYYVRVGPASEKTHGLLWRLEKL